MSAPTLKLCFSHEVRDCKPAQKNTTIHYSIGERSYPLSSKTELSISEGTKCANKWNLSQCLHRGILSRERGVTLHRNIHFIQFESQMSHRGAGCNSSQPSHRPGTLCSSFCQSAGDKEARNKRLCNVEH